MGNELYWPDHLPAYSASTATSLKIKTQIMLASSDEALNGLIRGLLAQYCPGISVTAVAYDLDQAGQLLRRQAFDWLIVDVDLKGGTGFDLLSCFSQKDTPVIYMAESYESAFLAFRHNATDCLLKPLVPQELMNAVKKAQQCRQTAFMQRQYNKLLQAGSSLGNNISLPVGSGCVFAQANEITRLESCGNYTFVYFANRERCLVSRNLKEMEDVLPRSAFFRPHQSHIVNIHFVRQFRKEVNCTALMHDGAQVPVARRRKDDFLVALTAM